MKVLVGILAFLQIFVMLPIAYFIGYRVLQATNQGELVWFLFWVYVPLGLLLAVLKEVANNALNKQKRELTDTERAVMRAALDRSTGKL